MTHERQEQFEEVVLIEIGHKVSHELESMGVRVESLTQFSHAPYQRHKKGTTVRFNAVTNNVDFFGKNATFDWRREYEMISSAQKVALPDLSLLFSGGKTDIDVQLLPKVPFFEDVRLPQHISASQTSGTTQDVKLQSLQNLLSIHQIEEGSDFAEYGRKYGLTDVVTHNGYYISPDVITVETLETLIDSQQVNSVLEIGSGIGISGVAAERAGITDLTFVDNSPTITNYLQSRFKYPVIQANAFDVPIDRDYDLILLGIHYGLNPLLIEKRGAELAKHGKFLLIQSSTVGMFESNHNWLMGDEKFKQWPFFNDKQTVGNYFSNVVPTAFHWQRGILATNEGRNTVEDVQLEMHKRGFKEPWEKTIVLSS